MALSHKDINLLTQKATIAGTEKIPVSDTEYVTTNQIASLGGGGSYTENAEWVWAITDSEDRVLLGIKYDGSVEWTLGIPSPINQVLGDIETLLAAL